MARKKIEINKNRGSVTEDVSASSIYDSPIELPSDFGITSTSGIVSREDGSLEVSNIRIHHTGLEFIGEVSEDEYAIFGETLLQIESAYQWIVGDYLAYGVDNNYGMAREFSERLGRDEATIHNWTSVCRSVTFSRRRENLSFKHHTIVSAMNPDQQDHWLGLSTEHGWSSAKLKKEISIAQGEALPENNNVPIYKKWNEQSDQRAVRALSQYRKEKDGRKRSAWKRYIESEARRWQQILDEIENS